MKYITYNNIIPYLDENILHIIYSKLDDIYTRRNFREAFKKLIEFKKTARDIIQDNLEKQYVNTISRMIKHPGDMIIEFPFKTLYAIIVLSNTNINMYDENQQICIQYLYSIYSSLIILHGDRYLLCFQ
jgi:hypothetical protein